MSDILTPKEYADYSREWKMGISIGPNLGACFCATIDALAEALRLTYEPYALYDVKDQAIFARVAAWLEAEDGVRDE